MAGRKLTEEHKQKLRDAKNKYYSLLEGKRPYNRTIEKRLNLSFVNNSLELIMKFNNWKLEHGDITEEILDEKTKEGDIEYLNNFF